MPEDSAVRDRTPHEQFFDSSPVCLGTAGWSLPAPLAPPDAVAVAHAALDGGVRVLDTAPAYTTADSESRGEDLVRAVLDQRDDRADLVVVTKAGHPRRGEGFAVDASPAALHADVRRSLRHLGTERLDLVLLHHVDPDVPLLESVGALEQARRDGLVARVGLSNVSREQVEAVLEEVPVACVQNALSLLDRQHEGLARWCTGQGVAFMAYSPLGGAGGAAALQDVPGLALTASRHGVSPQRAALAWVRSRGAAPVVGARRRETAQDAAGAALLDLDDEDLDALDGGRPA